MKLSQIKSVSQKIEQGAWIRSLPNLPGVAVKVRGYGNSDYRRRLAELRGTMTPDQIADRDEIERVHTQLVCETILQDWSGIEDASYSLETAKELLSDPDMAVLRSAVDYAASVVAEQGQEALETDQKNSSRPSAGK